MNIDATSLPINSDSTPIHSMDLIGRRATPILVAIIFVIAIGFIATYFIDSSQTGLLIVFATMAGGYMALNIGANDVANNVGPAVGSGALSLFAAVCIAIVFESAGALLAGGDVVSTISKGIIDPTLITDKTVFVLAMVSALAAGALWLNLATWVGAPVSTTHAIVGGVLGAAIAAAGFTVVNWTVMSKIVASWFISPILGGVVAAAFLAFIESAIFSKSDLVAASRRWVPVLLGIMAAAFSVYLMMKGFKKIWRPNLFVICGTGLSVFILVGVALAPLVNRASRTMENRRHGVNKLFTFPLIFAAALLSFAHGANDVANAIGPLSAIVSVASTDTLSAQVEIPLWVMMIGAIGISLGLALFGAKLIRTVGKQLTNLDQSRAFCVCLSAAITVIAASAFGLPVSSTHIAIGAVFGVGFYREARCMARRNALRNRRAIIASLRARLHDAGASTMEVVPRISCKPRKLVRRQELLTIAAAWLVTVPVAAILAAILFTVFAPLTGH